MTEKTDIEKMKDMAGFKFPEITKGLEELKAQQVIANTELRKIVKSKQSQQESDDKFRKDWKNAKVFDTRLSLWVLLLANAALYLDVIKINSDGTIVTAILSLFG